MPRTKWIAAYDGDWFPIGRTGYPIQCCDCSLVHRLSFKLKKGKLWMQAVRDNRATAQLRHYRFS